MKISVTRYAELLAEEKILFAMLSCCREGESLYVSAELVRFIRETLKPAQEEKVKE